MTVFRSVKATLLLHLSPEKKGFVGEVLHIIPAKMARFDQFQFSTDDPETISQVRKSPAFKTGEIVEIPVDEIEAARIPGTTVGAGRTVRGAISSASIGGEMGIPINPESDKMRLKETKAPVNTQCQICGKVFADDFSGKAVRMHEVSHRKKAAAEAAKPESVSAPTTEGTLKVEEK